MSNLQHRQSIIQEKRKKTPWRDFVMEICSRYPVNLYKVNGLITTYPDTKRQGLVIDSKEYTDAERKTVTYTDDFFSNFHNLYEINSKPNVRLFGENENSNFTDGSYGTKNCYLSFGLGNDIENGIYTFFATLNCSNIMNSVYVASNSSNIINSIGVKSSFNVFYSANINLSRDIRFSSNLIGCSDCIHCEGLNNQKYCIENKEYSKDEFLIKKKGNFEK